MITLLLSSNQTHTYNTPKFHTWAPDPDTHVATGKSGFICSMSSVHRFYASDVALGELICTNRTDNESEIIILGKEAHTLPNASCSFQLPLAPSICCWPPLTLVLNCLVLLCLPLRLCAGLALLRGLRVVQEESASSCWGLESAQEPGARLSS